MASAVATVASTPADRMTVPIRSAMPLCALLGVTAEQASAELVELHLDWRADLCTSGGLLHGGAVMALVVVRNGSMVWPAREPVR